MLNVVMLSATYKAVILSAIMLNVVMLSVTYKAVYAECHYAETSLC